MNSVVIVGGGYTGALAAILLSRYSRETLDITVVDPGEQPGRGLAYTTTDSNHRLNGPDFAHVFYPDDPAHFPRWLRSSGRLDSDPDALVANGWVYARRSDFGDYVCEQFKTHQHSNPSNSRVHHVKNVALSVERQANNWIVSTPDQQISAAQCLIATGHATPQLPQSLVSLANDKRVVNRPFTSKRLRQCHKNARVLVLGQGLTAADVLTSLIGGGHQGPIMVVSRSGSEPSEYFLSPACAQPDVTQHPGELIWQALTDSAPDFVQRHGKLTRIRSILAALRSDIRASEQHWSHSFDALRNSASVVWSHLNSEEKRRFFRHLKRRYDVCRYRYPPPTKTIIDTASATGQIQTKRGELRAATSYDPAQPAAALALELIHPEDARNVTVDVDLLVNCTGPHQGVARSHNPLYQALLRDGFASASPTGIGFAVDKFGQSLNNNGEPVDGLYLLGPPVYGELGEVINGPFITRQVASLLPKLGITVP